MSKTTRVIFYLSSPSALLRPFLALPAELCISRAMFIGTSFYCFYPRTSPQMQTELRLTPDPMTHSTSTMKCLPIRKPEGWMWDFRAVVHGKSVPIVFQKILGKGVKLWRWKQARAFADQRFPIKIPPTAILPIREKYLSRDLSYKSGT